ncbi:MAG: membrane-bound lytic murein transglycosylase MltF [Thermodesulfobacteriota bacterium]
MGKKTLRIRLHIILPPLLLGASILFFLLWWTREKPVSIPVKETLVIRSAGEEPAPDFVRNGKLVILTRNSPTTYYEGRFGPAGFEYDLATAFARSLGVVPEFVVMESVPAILNALAKGKGDIAAAGVARTPERERRFAFGPAYSFVEEQLVCRRSANMPRSIKGIQGKDLVVIKGSRHEKLLSRLKERFSDLTWESNSDYSEDQLLEMVAQGEIEATVADSNLTAVNQRYYPQLAVAFSLSEKQNLAWVTRKNDVELLSAVYNFFREPEGTRALNMATERHFGHIGDFDYVDITSFHGKIQADLPVLRPMFEEAARKNNVTWHLLAALSYQESHWNECAQSEKGAQGLMMLTGPTAQLLGVCDPLDPGQSIMGGAKYISEMIKAVPDSVEGRENRIRFALAAYNVGLGHLLDARALARKMGKNPDRWRDIKEMLPLLSQQQYYKDLQHGYARGGETVQFVQRVINYRDILEKATLRRGSSKKVAKISESKHTASP